MTLHLEWLKAPNLLLMCSCSISATGWTDSVGNIMYTVDLPSLQQLIHAAAGMLPSDLAATEHAQLVSLPSSLDRMMCDVCVSQLAYGGRKMLLHMAACYQRGSDALAPTEWALAWQSTPQPCPWASGRLRSEAAALTATAAEAYGMHRAAAATSSRAAHAAG
jgi:hypothetical protein